MTLPFDPIEEAGRQWREHWPAEPVEAMMAVTSVMRVQQLWLARCNEVLTGFGLTFPRFEALALLSFTRHGELPLGKMGQRLQVHPTSITNVIDGLERDGLVDRVPHPSDRHTTLAQITAPGRARVRDATDALHAISFGAHLDSADLDALTELLRRERAAGGDFAP